MSASVLKKCGLIRRPSPRKSVQTSRPSSAWQIFSASGPDLRRSRRRRGRRDREACGPPARHSSARAITWSVSSPCRARMPRGPTSEMMSIPPCARKKTGAGGVPCSRRRRASGGTRDARCRTRTAPRARTTPSPPGSQRRKEARAARTGTPGPDRRASTSRRRPCTGRTRGRGGPAARSRARGSRRRSESAPASRAIAQTAFASTIALDR